MISTFVARTVAVTPEAIRNAGLEPHELADVFVIGGSARIPAVRQELEAVLGHPVTTLGDPKLVVAEGAATSVPAVGRPPEQQRQQERQRQEQQRQQEQQREQEQSGVWVSFEDDIHGVADGQRRQAARRGMTGHPDHRAVSAWTDRAAQEASGTDGRVLHAVVTAGYRRHFGHLLESIDGGDDAFPAVGRRHLAVDLVLRSTALERKLTALDAHASQVGPLQRMLGSDGYRRLAAGEWFRAAERRS